MLDTIDHTAAGLTEVTNSFYVVFQLINVLCYLNLLFFIQ